MIYFVSAADADQNLYNLALKGCWRRDPAARLTFAAIQVELQKIAQQEKENNPGCKIRDIGQLLNSELTEKMEGLSRKATLAHKQRRASKVRYAILFAALIGC